MSIPYYYKSLDWDDLVSKYPPPEEFMESTWQWSRDQIAETQLKRLKETLEKASSIPFYQKLWKEHSFNPMDVQSLDDMYKIPMYTIEDIRDSIERKPPFGDYQRYTFSDGAHTPLRFYTSGGTTGAPRPTIYSQWDREVGAILSARTFYLQGIRPGDVVINAWAYSTHNAAWIMDHGMWHWLGVTPITTSTGKVTSTGKQMELAKTFGATSIIATSDYLLHMGQVAQTLGYDLKNDFHFKSLLAFGDTKAVEEMYGVPVYDSYAFHEVQYVAAECPAKNGLHIFEDAFIVEIVDFETGKPVPPGHQGNIVVTALYKTGTQQIRYNIQDITAMYEIEKCECGSWHRKIKYFQGRSDTMVKLRGVNVWPEACGEIIAKNPRTNGEYFCFVERDAKDGYPERDEMTILVEPYTDSVDFYSLKFELEEDLKKKFGVKINVEVEPLAYLESYTGRGHRAKLKRFEDRRPKGVKM